VIYLTMPQLHRYEASNDRVICEKLTGKDMERGDFL
jgi:hypothetical protein